MARIKNESELKSKLRQDIEGCGKEKVVIQAGHFPLLYLPEGAVEGINHWGHFSQYSLELGCEVGKIARDLGKEVQFVFFADDHSYGDMSGLNRTQRGKRRKKLYQKRSGEIARLPKTYREIMKRYGFGERDVLRHDHRKPGRESCLYFSELVLRASEKEVANACAREYVEFIEGQEYFDKPNTHLVSFVPNRCKGHICDVALEVEIGGLSASHVFMETMLPLASREELFQQARGVTHRKD